MGLLSEFTKVRLNSYNIKRLEQLGYDLPKKIGARGSLVSIKGAEIEIKVSDLLPNSNAMVWVECDNCHEKQEIKYMFFRRRKYNDGIHFYCQKCTYKLFQTGERSCHWKSELTDTERNCQRDTADYTAFIKKVFLRDNYTCQCCGKECDGHLVVHHLDGYNWCKERRTDVNNGITLCENCHQNFHLKYGKGDNTREQFEEWIGHSVKELGDYNGVLPTTKEVICYETQKQYKSVYECAKDMDLFTTCIYSCCNRKKGCYSTGGFHFFWKSDYEKMAQEDIEHFIQEGKDKIHYNCSISVICLNTGKRYKSMKDAASELGTTGQSIATSCKNNGQAIGRHTKYRWMYINEFDNLSIEEQQKLL